MRLTGNQSPKNRTREEFNKMFDCIYRIKFTTETADDLPTGRLPTLDCELWMKKLGTIQ